MGVGLNISTWRHICIAIARKYLNEDFGTTDDNEREWDSNNEDNMEDNVLDLQTGHGTAVAGMIYDQELQQGTGTMAHHEMFRKASLR
jgi:hypothetical protein